ncbi:MAG TPA: 50S ribosomal protein L4 [Pirellulaceae bacterium]|nr:50S ribosomal protein L4 [Pirellulaceae bacterium]HMO92204.1 50S ribosomal protein L4 [Pirellulaceae bacterium]HMP68869.1 50S ribosomal protein L4 [Pirellulaceae bacterium]
MASLPVYNQAGEKVGTYDINPSEIAATVNKQLLHDAVVMYQANLRQGTHRTKTRGEVAGSTKKMYRQKGTGNARAGSKRSGIRRGGGHIFARRPRDYSYRLPRKALQLATKMALASKIENAQVIVLDSISIDAPKTKTVAKMLNGMGVIGNSTLIATSGHDPNVYKSARNIDRVSVLPLSDLNAYAILRNQRLVVTRAALDTVKNSAQTADAS